MRIAIAQVSHETNTFSSEPTDEAAFRIRSWIEGEELLSRHRGVKDYIGGMIDEASALGDVELLPTFGAITSPSGTIRAETWAEIKRRVLAGLETVAPFDAICLELHGAGVAETTGDIEGDLLRMLRMLYGTALPIVATLDLHGNITDRMIDNADMLFGVKEYPHIDMYDRGRDAIRNVHRMVQGTLRPRMALTRLPLVIPTTTTFHGPLKAVNARCESWEAKPGLVHCAAYHGFPYADSSATCVSVIAIAEDDEALAQAATRDVADFIWAQRDVFAIVLPGAAEGLETALSCPESPVIVNETSDNPGAGAPGDGTWLLAEMLRRNAPRTCFAHLADAEVVATAHAAGEGRPHRGQPRRQDGLSTWRSAAGGRRGGDEHAMPMGGKHAHGQRRAPRSRALDPAAHRPGRRDRHRAEIAAARRRDAEAARHADGELQSHRHQIEPAFPRLLRDRRRAHRHRRHAGDRDVRLQQFRLRDVGQVFASPLRQNMNRLPQGRQRL